MEWGNPVEWGWFLLFSRSGGHKTKETYPTRLGSPTPCKQGLSLSFSRFVSSGNLLTKVIPFKVERNTRILLLKGQVHG